MAGQLPIQFTELAQLNQLGIAPTSIGFNTCTLESDSYVCVRQKVDDNDKPQVIIVNLKNNNEIIKRAISADSAIMHWKQDILALKAQGKTIQVFNLATKSKLKSTTMSEDVVFWKWFSENSLGLVTDTSVYHWNIFDPTQDAPVKMFERSPNLSGNQIINYRVSDDEQWMVVVGISQKEGRVAGSMQLYSKARGISQNIEGHAASFATFQAEGQPEPYKLFTFCVRTATSAKLHVVEIDPSSNNARFQKKAVDVYFPQEAVNDFPVAMQVSAKYSIIYMITKYGFIHLYDLETGTCIFMNRISNETIFVTAPDAESSGIVGINRKGQVLSVSLDENNAVPYLLQNPANTELATKLASRAGLAGADDLYRQQFENAFNSGNYQDAAKFAANSPRGFLRTAETINRFKSAQGGQGQMSVILQYFGLLLDKGKLNRYETVELIKPVLAQNRKQLLTKWMGEGKLDYSEELGDIVRLHDLEAALTIYREAGVPSKTVAALAETGRFEEILPYSTQVGYQPDFVQLLQHIVRVNPEKGAEFATQLANTEGGPMVDVGRVVDIFMSQNMVQQATAFLLDALKDNREDQGQLQTRLLEMNLINAPQVADAILGNQMFTHYDKARISQLCEQAGLLQRALENTDDPSAIKRIIVQTDKLSPDFLQQYFSRLSVDQSLDAMNEMLTSNIRQNLQAVLQIATKYSELLGPSRLIELFERHRTAEGLYYFLGSIVNLSEDPEVVFKYLEAAVTMQQFTEVERICRENNVYQPEKVKAFLIEAQLSEQLPLIIVCDRFNYVKDLVNYLYKHQQYKSIEVYVQQVNPSRTPAVVGALLALDCDEKVIQNLLRSVDASAVPIDELVQEVESQNRLKILLPFLEAAQQSGTAQTGALANALAKIYIDTNNNPEAYLKENNEYDSLVVGKYCEKRDPNLAFIAYSKGQNDLELLNVTNENSMFRAQARYLLDRADPEVWAFALGANNEHRRSLVDQVTATAVPESTEPDKVSVAVKAFVDADMPGELIDLLEKIILEPSPFSENGSLQNLLMLTAAKSDKARLMDYIHKLDQFSVDEISALCIEQGLYEEALAIHKKVNNHSEAANVLVDHIVSIDRAQDYAEEVDLPEVWSKVAKAQLDGLRVSDSIESYIKAQDPSNYNEVIETATHAGKDEELVKFLKMARKTQREPAIDTALAFSYARLDQLPELEDFLRSANVAESEAAGDRAYEEGYHQAAKIFFTSISNWAKLATTLVHLSEYQQAVDCARRANSVKVWKQVHEACVAQKEFRLAQICGLNLIVHAEELSDLVKDYERAGYFEELISLLEAGLGLERAHMGMFTELGIALSKYHPDRVMEHLKLFWSRINIPKMIRACEEAHLWPELIFLYCHYDEWDNAALAMMERAADAWEHHSFKDIVVKVANLEIYYRAINHYLQEQPLLLTDLLQALTPRIDVNRVVKIFKTSDNVPMIKPFLLNVQNQNKRTVNDAIHELLIEEEDYKTLRDSVENYDNYDAMNLAQRLEKHELVFFRQIAAQIYRKNKRWDRSIALSKQDKLFKDAIETSAISGKPEVVEELLRYFVDIGSRECYVGMLYACYDLIPMHVVMEISWRHGLNDFTMPFMISYMSQQSATIDQLKKDNDERKAREASQKKDDDNTPILGGRLMLTQGPANTAPSPAPYGQTNGITPQPTGFPRAF